VALVIKFLNFIALVSIDCSGTISFNYSQR